MEKYRILQFTIAATWGGRTRHILDIWNHIDKDKFQFDFVSFSKSKLTFENDIISHGGNVYYIHSYPEENLFEFEREFSKVLALKYDAIEIHTAYWKSMIVEEMAKDAGVHKIIIRASSSGINATLDRERANKALSQHLRIRDTLVPDIATDFWATSEEAANWLYADRIPKERIRIHNNTIDTYRFCFNYRIREEVRLQNGLQNHFVMGFSGRLEAVKNVDFIIEILYSLRKIKKDIMLMIVGEGSLRKQLVDKCKTLKLHNSVIFTGFVENVADYLQAMDIFLLPSEFEGFPNALLEAQSVGLPCIASDNITKEAIVTEVAHRLPIDKNQWIKEIRKYLLGYDRIDRSCELREKGYCTRTVIEQLQKEYME